MLSYCIYNMHLYPHALVTEKLIFELIGLHKSGQYKTVDRSIPISVEFARIVLFNLTNIPYSII
jgi:hypothetical protein